MEFPPSALKFNLTEFIRIKPAAGQRIIDPQTGYQYEITYKDVELDCPICHRVQPAPPIALADYRCPGCGWYYKVQDNLLVVFSPQSIQVTINALEPGEFPPQMVVDGAIQDSDSVAVQYKNSTDTWRRAVGNNEEKEAWGRRVQILTTEALKK